MTRVRGLRWQDYAVPGALLVLGAAELASLGAKGWVASIGLETVAAAFLVFRRVAPAVAVPCSALALMAMPFTGARIDDAATPIFFYVLGIYSLGRYLSLSGGLLMLAVTLALVAVDFMVDPGPHDPTDAVFIASLAVPPYAFGRVSRKLAEQSALLEHQSVLLRDQAVQQERERIARELHDVIAHSLSAMVVQTAAAQDLVHRDPDAASGILRTVAETGRRALHETGRLLHLVRDEADELGLRPAPGLADVPGLVDQFRTGGLAVDMDLDVEPSRAPLPGAADVCAYRLVQEALTNALKHGDGTVALRVRAHDDQLTIFCSNPVNGSASGSGSELGSVGHDRARHPPRGADPHRAHRRRPLRGRGRDPADRGRVVSPGETTVVIADDQELVRTGLSLVLEGRGCEVVGCAADGRQAIEVVRRTQPDVVLMDIRMPVMDGIAATKELVSSGSPTRVLVLTTYDLDRYVYDALAAGAAGFLLKATPPERLVEGIRTVCAGESLLAPSLTRRLIEEYLRHPPPSATSWPGYSELTDRERQVLVLMARGRSNDQIADELVVAHATVKTHVNRVLAKLGVTSRVQAVVAAFEHGIVRPGAD